MQQEIMYKNWCSVNLDNLVHNYQYTKNKVNKTVICVIKADAYGHGAVTTAKALEEAGCRHFAVSSFAEAKELRDGGIDKNILILGVIMPHEIQKAIELDISFAVGSLDFLESVIFCQTASTKKAKIHIKLNTGMNRLGFDVVHSYDELEKALALIKENLQNIEVEGIFSHFASAEDDNDLTRIQFERYNAALKCVENAGISPKLRHISNSAASLNYDEFYLDATRLGIYLYGCETNDKNYLPVMGFHSRILEIQEIQAGDGVSYGLDFIADKKMKIAIVGAGYADGVHRSLSNGKGYVICGGKECPIVGRICMDMFMIDVTELENVSILDTVTIFGEGSGGYLPCSVQAQNAGTISYELLCSVSERVPRIYT